MEENGIRRSGRLTLTRRGSGRDGQTVDSGRGWHKTVSDGDSSRRQNRPSDVAHPQGTISGEEEIYIYNYILI